MKKDPTSMEFCAGTPWPKAEAWLKGNAHMFAMGKDEDALSVAKTAVRYGTETAVAELAARLALKKNGLKVFTAQATGMYKDITEEFARNPNLTDEGKKRAERLRHEVMTMEQWMAWAGCVKSPNVDFKWPIEMPKELWDDLDKRAGLANVMLFIAAEELDAQSGTGLLAMNGIMRFLTKGSKE